MKYNTIGQEMIGKIREEVISIELTPEELEEAILERKKRKLFHEKHFEYWNELEFGKIKKDARA